MLKAMIVGLSLLSFVVMASGCFLLVGAVVGGSGTAVWLSGKLSDKANA